MAADIPSSDLLHALSAAPNNETLHHELDRRLVDHSYDREFSVAVNDYFEQRPAVTKVVTSPPGLTWSNYIGQQTCHPQKILKPTCLRDLLNAIQEGRKSNLKVRAVGSGHSYSDVCPTDGILLDPHGVNQSGITIHDLNIKLDHRERALINMGAYDGQTLVGAISTGTHGTGLRLGPLASCVRSLILVSESGTVYQLEPTDGITDPAKFDPGPDNIVLKQDDDWFLAAVVAMGCIGLIYAYTIEVEHAYFLQEFRTLSTCEDIKPLLLAGPSSPLLTDKRHFELDINPYADITNRHICIKVEREKHDGPVQGTRGFDNWLGGVLASWHAAEKWLVWFLNWQPASSRGLISRALRTLVTPDLKVGYIDKSFKVMNLGTVNNVKAMAIELSLDAANNLVDQVDKLIAIFERVATQSGWYMAGPISLRFVAPATALIASQEGRATCMVELDMLVGIKNGENLLKLVQAEMCQPGNGVRVHWGLDLDTVTGQQAQDVYPQWQRWLNVYRQFNFGGMWNSKFTNRLGISAGP